MVVLLLAVLLPVGAYLFAVRAAPAAARASLGPVLAPDTFILLKLLVVFAIFASPLVVAALLAAKFLLPTSWRTFTLGSLVTLATAAAYVEGHEVGSDRAWTVRRELLHDLAARSEPVVAAVESYIRANRRPPARWTDLVPEFLPDEPATGMAAHPRFELIVDPERLARRYGNNPWAIRLDIFGSGTQRWDELVFLPRQNYEPLGSSVVPVGRWALRGS
ncbi:MAG: hypothetical protein J0L84_20010 [Verrucomicrobia bacterium]|nr:hypothetical protein [Verrucomicrobiota bacterium]